MFSSSQARSLVASVAERRILSWRSAWDVLSRTGTKEIIHFRWKEQAAHLDSSSHIVLENFRARFRTKASSTKQKPQEKVVKKQMSILGDCGWSRVDLNRWSHAKQKRPCAVLVLGNASSHLQVN